MDESFLRPARSILVIEDDESLNQLFCQLFQSNGFITQSVHNYANAAALLKTGTIFDLIILDHQLGDGTGLQLLADLKRNQQVKTPPVIMISSNQDAAFLENCFACGITDYLIKPVNFSLLALKVNALIQTVAMQNVIALQNIELERFKADAQREEMVAKFTYEYLLRRNSQVIDGVTTWLKPSSAFSGDIALTKVSPNGDFYFLLADATGHGLSAAITLIPMVSIFNSMVDKGFCIQPLVTEINKKLIRDTPEDRFVAAVIIHWRRQQNEIDVWNGGMPAVCWVHQHQIFHSFASRHMALGILEENVFDDSVVSCEAHAYGTLIAYSDGLIEEANSDGVSFSAKRVADNICNSPADVLQSLVKELEVYTGRKKYRDDISICVLDAARIFAVCN